jgi:hypothetical protein
LHIGEDLRLALATAGACHHDPHATEPDGLIDCTLQRLCRRDTLSGNAQRQAQVDEVDTQRNTEYSINGRGVLGSTLFKGGKNAADVFAALKTASATGVAAPNP